MQFIRGRNGIVILVPPAHDEPEFVVGAIPQALAEGIAYALGRQSPPSGAIRLFARVFLLALR
jgi:hypothetical protein